MLKHIPFYAVLLDRPLPNGKQSTNSHVLVYGAIEAHSLGPKGCIASNKTIAGSTGLKERSVATIISLLASAGWISVKLDDNNHRKGITPLMEIKPPSIGIEPPLQSGLNIDNSIRDNNTTYSSDKSLTDSKNDSVSFGGNSNSAPDPDAPPTALKLMCDVVKMYGLPITNFNNIRKWSNDLDKMDDGKAYLQKLLDTDIREAEGEFRPTLNTPFDIVTKKLKIQRFLNGGEDEKPRDPRVYGDF